MAESGRPLPFAMKERIAAMVIAGNSRRLIARELGLAKRTVDKYAKKCSRSVAQRVFQSSPPIT